MAQDTQQEITMDGSQLYREDVFTDNRIGTIRRMTPVNADGDTDAARPTLFVGSASLMTPAGSLPISFEIQATTLAEAVDGYGPAAQKALEETMQELQEMRRQAASSIVVPGAGGGGMPGGGMPGGGMPGGGGIQMP
ncbi:MAG: hypothetical protein AAGE01_01235 [Pseudomonadota bacterium]